MGQLQSICEPVNMAAQIASLLFVLLVLCALGQEASHKLPVLFQFSQPSHNVAVFRGADLKKAIAAGIVPGFGSLGAGSKGRGGKSVDSEAASNAAASSYGTPAPVSTPAPVLYKPVPVVYKPAPAPVVYKPAPLPIIYK